MKRLVRYFLNGLILLLPLIATFLILKYAILLVDNLVPTPFPGVGLIIVLISITLVGFLGRNVVFAPFVNLFLQFVEKTPVVSLIYRSTKEFTEAFIGNERKFENPILYDTTGEKTYRVGFLTQESFQLDGLKDHVGVYIPHSYNFSGNFYIVPKSRITPLPIPSTLAMRFALTGGAVNLTDKNSD